MVSLLLSIHGVPLVDFRFYFFFWFVHLVELTMDFQEKNLAEMCTDAYVALM